MVIFMVVSGKKVGYGVVALAGAVLLGYSMLGRNGANFEGYGVGDGSSKTNIVVRNEGSDILANGRPSVESGLESSVLLEANRSIRIYDGIKNILYEKLGNDGLLSSFFSWDSPEGFENKYGKNAIPEGRNLTFGEIRGEMDIDSKLKDYFEKSGFSQEVADMYSGINLATKIGSLTTMDVGSLTKELWKNCGTVWQAHGRDDVLRRMFLDGEVESKLTEAFGSLGGSSYFYGNEIASLLKSSGRNVPKDFEKTVGEYFGFKLISGDKKSEMKYSKLQREIFDVIGPQITEEDVNGGIVDSLSKVSRWDAFAKLYINYMSKKEEGK